MMNRKGRERFNLPGSTETRKEILCFPSQNLHEMISFIQTCYDEINLFNNTIIHQYNGQSTK